jgi:hypothetical protein
MRSSLINSLSESPYAGGWVARICSGLTNLCTREIICCIRPHNRQNLAVFIYPHHKLNPGSTWIQYWSSIGTRVITLDECFQPTNSWVPLLGNLIETSMRDLQPFQFQRPDRLSAVAMVAH